MATIDDLGIVWKQGIAPEDSPQGWDFCTGPYTNFGAREWHEWGMHIQKDIPIPTRHGTLYADLFRPDGLEPNTKLPIVMGYSPYGKHARPQFPAGISPSLLSHYSIGEAPDPGYWTRQGYAVAYVDAVGSFHSEGTYVCFGSIDAEAGADAVDWLGSREWSNGAVAIAGASYYSMIGYRIAAQQPKHLKALVPWEGGIRVYDGFVNHGGIPSTRTSFFPGWSEKWCSIGLGKMEDVWATIEVHPNFDEYWADKMPDLSAVTIPVFTSSSGTCQRCWNWNGSFWTISSRARASCRTGRECRLVLG
jgi:predicted acyl esterase